MSEVRITLFGALRRAVGKEEVEVKASTLREALDRLVSRYGGQFKERVYDQTGKPRSFINIYINGKDIRFLKNLDTVLKNGDEISMIPAVSGG